MNYCIQLRYLTNSENFSVGLNQESSTSTFQTKFLQTTLIMLLRFGTFHRNFAGSFSADNEDRCDNRTLLANVQMDSQKNRQPTKNNVLTN